MQTKNRRGAPPKSDAVAKRAKIFARVASDTLAALEVAARQNAQTLSREVEQRLRHSLNFDSDFKRYLDQGFGDAKAFALMQVLARVARRTTALTAIKRDWYDDPYMFDVAVKAMNAALHELRPRGTARRPKWDLFGRASSSTSEDEMMIAIHVRSALLDIRDARDVLNGTPKMDGGRRIYGQEALTALPLKVRLGHIAKRLESIK